MINLLKLFFYYHDIVSRYSKNYFINENTENSLQLLKKVRHTWKLETLYASNEVYHLSPLPAVVSGCQDTVFALDVPYLIGISVFGN